MVKNDQKGQSLSFLLYECEFFVPYVALCMLYTYSILLFICIFKCICLCCFSITNGVMFSNFVYDIDLEIVRHELFILKYNDLTSRS